MIYRTNIRQLCFLRRVDYKVVLNLQNRLVFETVEIQVGTCDWYVLKHRYIKKEFVHDVSRLSLP